jgi:hypothetical protein
MLRGRGIVHNISVLLRPTLRINNSLCKMSSTISTPGSPSSTTTILLRNLPNSATNETVAAVCKDTNMRRVEIEPGFTCHLTSEIDANYLSTYLKNNHQSHTNIVNTTMPAVVLSNMSELVSIESIKSSFQKYNPRLIQMIGTSSYEVLIIIMICALMIY